MKILIANVNITGWTTHNHCSFLFVIYLMTVSKFYEFYISNFVGNLE
jgi:hypothetical protein